MLTETLHFRTDRKTRCALVRIAKLNRRKVADMLRVLIVQEAARLDGQAPGKGELAPVQPAAEGRRDSAPSNTG